MFMTILVYLDRDALPTRAALADTMKRRGFEAPFDDSFDPREQYDLIPGCGEDDPGFAYSFEAYDPAEAAAEDADIQALIGNRNAEVEMTYDWPHDYPITAAVAAALAELTDGAVCDNDAGDWYAAGDEAWAWAERARKTYGKRIS